MTTFKFGWPDMNPLVKTFREYQGTIRFLLGFMLVYYYQEIYARARRIFFAIPFPDSVFMAINSVVGDGTSSGRLLKKTIFRYILAATFLSYHSSSSLFRHAYPKSFTSMKQLGLLNDGEINQLRQRIQSDYPYPGEVSFIPLAWATMTLRKAFEDGQIYPDYKHSKTHDIDEEVPISSQARTRSNAQYPTAVHIALDAVHEYRRNYGSMLFEVYFAFPLLLSQLVTLVVYFYFMAALVAQQNMKSEPHFVFPVFTMAEFVVYMGALRVGQTFTNPLGRDENSFEMVAFFHRNLRLAHIYGGYGDDRYDIVQDPLPIVDLSDVQRHVMPTIPLTFYSMPMARARPSFMQEEVPGRLRSMSVHTMGNSKVMNVEPLISNRTDMYGRLEAV